MRICYTRSAMMYSNIIFLFAVKVCCVENEVLMRLKLSTRNKPAMIPRLIATTVSTKTISCVF